MASMSYASARVTTSASRPSTTARACLPEPPCDWFTTTVAPVLSFQYFAKAALSFLYSSRVGSYETFRSCTSARACPASRPATAARTTTHRTRPSFSMPLSLVGGFMREVPRSKRDLKPVENHLLVLAVAGGVAVLEAGPDVIQHPLDVAAQDPVDADAALARSAGRLGRVGECGERLVIYLESPGAQDQLEGTPAMGLRIEHPPGSEPPVGRTIVGQGERHGRLPGGVLEVLAARGDLDLLVRLDVLGERAEPPDVPVGLG